MAINNDPFMIKAIICNKGRWLSNKWFINSCASKTSHFWKQCQHKTRHGYIQRWLLYNATTLYNICRFKSCISKKPTNIAVTKNVVTNIAIQHMLVKCCAPTFSCRSYPCLSRRVKEKTLKVFSVMMKRYSVNLWK